MQWSAVWASLLIPLICEMAFSSNYHCELLAAQGYRNSSVLLRGVREQIKSETDQALKQEEARYKDSTDGPWLEEREEYYKALTESLYLQRRAGLIETLFALWSDVLRTTNGVERRNLPNAGKE
jgi:hypothetical protein